jgi:MFS family permease
MIIVGIQEALDYNIPTFLPTYFVKVINLDQLTAAYCQSVFSSSIFVGRLINIFISIIIDVKIMIFVNFILMIIGNYLMITVDNSLTGIYIGMAILGIGSSSSYPLLISFVEQTITLTNKRMSIINFSSALFITISPIVLGKLIDAKSEKFLLFNFNMVMFSFIIFIILLLLEHRRFNSKNFKKV